MQMVGRFSSAVFCDGYIRVNKEVNVVNMGRYVGHSELASILWDRRN